MIRRNTLNFAIDFVTLLIMFGVAMTGLFLRFVLPPGSRGGAGRSLWSWDRHDFGDLHFYLVLGLLSIVVVHLALHWNWVCVTVRNWFARGGGPAAGRHSWLRPASGVLALTLIVSAGAVLFMVAMKRVELGTGAQRDSSGLQGRGRGAWLDTSPRQGRGGHGRGAAEKATGVEP